MAVLCVLPNLLLGSSLQYPVITGPTLNGTPCIMDDIVPIFFVNAFLLQGATYFCNNIQCYCSSDMTSSSYLVVHKHLFAADGLLHIVQEFWETPWFRNGDDGVGWFTCNDVVPSVNCKYTKWRERRQLLRHENWADSLNKTLQAFVRVICFNLLLHSRSWRTSFMNS